jgi:hypothetical protein
MEMINKYYVTNKSKNKQNLGSACYSLVYNSLCCAHLCESKEINMYYNVTVLLYGCKTMREKHGRLRVLKTGCLERCVDRGGEEGIGSWRRLHGEELHNLYFLSNITVW